MENEQQSQHKRIEHVELHDKRHTQVAQKYF